MARQFINPEAAAALIGSSAVDSDAEKPLTAAEEPLSRAAQSAASTVASELYGHSLGSLSSWTIDHLTNEHILRQGIPLSSRLLTELLTVYSDLVVQSGDVSASDAAPTRYKWFSDLLNCWTVYQEREERDKRFSVHLPSNMLGLTSELDLGNSMMGVDLELVGSSIRTNLGYLAAHSTFTVPGNLIGSVLDSAYMCKLNAGSIYSYNFLEGAVGCQVEADEIFFDVNPRTISGGCKVVASVIEGDIVSIPSIDPDEDYTAHIACKTLKGTITPTAYWTVKIGGEDA